MAKRYIHSFNALLDRFCYEALEKLSDKSGLSRGHIIRTLIRNATAHSERKRFICANGAPCLAPQLLITPPSTHQGTFEPTPDQFYENPQLPTAEPTPATPPKEG